MKKIIIFFALAIVLLYGCEQIVCNSPYIQVGKECCLDADSNNICDKDEKAEEKTKITITEKEPQVIEKEVQKFVCSDGSIVDSASKCPIEESKPIEEEKQVEEIPELMNNENGTIIEKVIVEPACPSGLQGGKIYFKVGTVPAGISIQVKESDSEYQDVFKRTGLYEQYQYFAICDKCRGAQIDFKLKPDKVYVLRLMFNQTVYDRLEYSNEHLIDTRADSEYMLNFCGN